MSCLVQQGVERASQLTLFPHSFAQSPNIGYLALGYRADNALLETVSGGATSTTFGYDSLGQVLRAATVNDVSGDTVFRQGFTYDRLGRLTGLAERVQSDRGHGPPMPTSRQLQS